MDKETVLKKKNNRTKIRGEAVSKEDDAIAMNLIEMKYSNKEIQKIIPYENWYIDELRVMFVGKSDARKYAAENMKELGKTDEEIFRATGIKIK